MTLESRLAKLEGAARDGMQQIRVTGGLADCGPDDLANAAGQTWRRAPGETADAFQCRVLAEARALGASCVVWGGLPD